MLPFEKLKLLWLWDTEEVRKKSDS